MAESAAASVLRGRTSFRVYGARWDGGRYRCTMSYPERTEEMMGRAFVNCKHSDSKYRATVKFRISS